MQRNCTAPEVYVHSLFNWEFEMGVVSHNGCGLG